MKKSLLAGIMMAFAGAVPAAVQNLTITDANAYAYNAGNRLVCDSGSKILVTHSYRADGTTLKAALLDFIDVTPPAEGADDPWVSIRLLGAGLTNDVDFTEQPYLWLGTTEGGKVVHLAGVYEPYGDVYRFGYCENVTGEYNGLAVTNLTDNPVTGAPRSVLAAGTGNILLAGGTYTGGVVAEGPVYISVNGTSSFSKGYASAAAPAITLRSVNGKGARLQLKGTNVVYPADLEIRNEGTNAIHSCGAITTVRTTLKGPVTGWGQINLTDQGGLHLTSAANTFTGKLNVSNAHATHDVEIGIGDGVNCSWAGCAISQPNLTNHIVIVNCDKDFTLDAELSANGGRLVKRGTGTLTLAKAFPRGANAARPDIPVMQILGGAVRRTQTEPAAADALVEIAAGGTFDLNGIPATAIGLPVGGGTIVNPADGAVAFRGPASPTKSFYGSVAGRASVQNTAGSPWLLDSSATFLGGLALSNGTIRAVDGFSSADLDLAGNARLDVVSRTGSDVGGLRMEVWWTGTTWTGDGHMARLEEAIAYAAAHEAAPNFSGDMTAWGETFYSGTGDTAGGQKGAFFRTLGTSRDHFVAKFSGYFIAEETGVYAFRGAADDGVRIILDGTNQIVNIAAGTHGSWGENVNVPLAAGRHPITVYFLEEGGWEILWVQMKAPGATEWEYVPVRLLSTWDGRRSALRAVTGTGAIALGSNDVAWPEMDLSAFAGSILANDYTATDTAGTVTPVSSRLYFEGGANDLLGNGWWRSGYVSTLDVAGRPALDFGGVKESNNYLNRRTPLDLSKPFTVSFDFSVHAPWASDGSLGDGFALMLSDSFASGYGGVYSFGTGERIKNAGAYGIQCYLMPTVSHFAWIKNNVCRGNATTNTAYVLNRAKDRTKPFHVTFAWDLETLVCTFEQTGTSPLAFTNTYAKDDLAEKFPSGKAYLGIWARNGGWYCTMLFENLVVAEDGTPAGDTTVVLDGVLGITNGIARAIAPNGVAPVLASDLQVVGAGGIETVVPVALTGARWAFDLRNPETKLALAGSLTFPGDGPITVDLTGDPTPQPRILADLTGIAGTEADGLQFQLDASAPASWKLDYTQRILRVFQNVGTVISIR